MSEGLNNHPQAQAVCSGHQSTGRFFREGDQHPPQPHQVAWQCNRGLHRHLPYHIKVLIQVENGAQLRMGRQVLAFAFIFFLKMPIPSTHFRFHSIGVESIIHFIFSFE